VSKFEENANLLGLDGTFWTRKKIEMLKEYSEY